MGGAQAIADTIASRQDYLWFLAAIASTALVAMSRRVSAVSGIPGARLWLASAGTGGMATAAIELWLGIHVSTTGLQEYRPWSDAWLVLAGSIGPAGLVWIAVPERPARHRWWRASLITVLVLGAGIRLWAPIQSGVWYHGNLFERGPAPLLAALALTAVQLILIIAVSRSTWGATLRRTAPATTRRWFVLALVLMALLAVFNTSGPIAEGAGYSRRWGLSGLSPLGSVSAVLQLSLAVSLAVIWWQWLADSAAVSSTALQREWRWIGRLSLVWLGMGVALAEWTGRAARVNFEKSLLMQARTAALLFDRGLVSRCLGPGLQLGQPVEYRQSSGTKARLFEAEIAAEPEFDQLRKLLALIVANTDAVVADIEALKDGWIITAVTPPQPGVPKNLVGAERLATAADLSFWAEADDRIVRLSGARLLTARVALRDPENQVRGWLRLKVSAAHWGASQAQARLLTFAVVAAGLVLAVMVAVHRWQVLRRQDAQRLASEAASATRAKTDFLAKVSHELRTPTQSILGYAQLLERAELTRDERSWLSALRNQTALMIRLVGDLLDLSALQMGTFRLVDQPTAFPTLLQEVMESLRHQAERKGLTLTSNYDDRLPAMVLCDGPRVRQVLLNLIANAVKFTRIGGINVSAIALSEFPATSGALWCEVTVRDTGPGIPTEDQERVFQPFARLEAAEQTEGVGLGLSLAAALLRSMGGDIRVESDGMSGSCFRARWPLRKVESAGGSRDAASNTHLVGVRVLVAEDNTFIRELLDAYLSSLGADVTTVADGETASSIARARHFDALILDIALPGRDGLSVARELRRAGAFHAGMKIIAVSAHAGDEVRRRAADDGVDIFLTKPVDLHELAHSIGATGPVESVRAPSRLPPELEQRFTGLFSTEFPQQRNALSEALAGAQWATLWKQAHYLHNSALILQLKPIELACRDLESAALKQDHHAAREALVRIQEYTPPFAEHQHSIP